MRPTIHPTDRQPRCDAATSKRQFGRRQQEWRILRNDLFTTVQGSIRRQTQWHLLRPQRPRAIAHRAAPMPRWLLSNGNIIPIAVCARLTSTGTGLDFGKKTADLRIGIAGLCIIDDQEDSGGDHAHYQPFAYPGVRSLGLRSCTPYVRGSL